MNIFHIGFSKCASSWLQTFFSSAKEINYLEKTHFFSPIYKNSTFNSDVEYPMTDKAKKKSEIVLESDEHIILPDYCKDLSSHGTRIITVKKVINKISDLFPNAKIILVIRNHSSLFISRYSQYIVGGGDLSIKDYFSKLNGLNGGVDYFENYYYEIISYLFLKFGRKNVHVIFQENLFNDNQIKSLSDFIKVDKPEMKTNILTMRKGLSFVGINLLRKMNSLFVISPRTFENSVKTRIPKIIYINFIIRLIRLIDYFLFKSNKFKASKLLKNDFEEYLKKKFLDDNLKLLKLLDDDIIRKKYL